MSNENGLSTVSQSAGDYVSTEVNFQARLREMQLMNYAIASGLPGVPILQKPTLNITDSTKTTTQPPSPTASGLSGIAKAGILAAALTGLGGVGLGAAALLKPNPTPAVTPAVPGSGQVSFGIGDDGKLVP